jgi:hypothetical protein
LNYMTRPAIAHERLERNHAGDVVLKLKSPYQDGTTHIVMSPLEFMQRLAALVPRPRYPWRARAQRHAALRDIPDAPKNDKDPGHAQVHASHCSTSSRISWARLLKRVFDIDIERCPRCSGELKIIAAIEQPTVIAKILAHLGLPTRAPPRPLAQVFDLFEPA